ncbi:hypothetical protein [Thalassotalea fusca]
MRQIHILNNNSNILVEKFDDRTLSDSAKKLISEIAKTNDKYIDIQSIKLSVLVEVSKYFDTEMGVAKSQGWLHLIKGRAASGDKVGRVSLSDGPAGATMLIHTHPTWQNYRSHFEQDLAVAEEEVMEAVVNWSEQIVVYAKGEIKNKKDSSGSGKLQALKYGDEFYPNFININGIIQP